MGECIAAVREVGGCYLTNYDEGNFIFYQGNIREFQSWSSVAINTDPFQMTML